MSSPFKTLVRLINFRRKPDKAYDIPVLAGSLQLQVWRTANGPKYTLLLHQNYDTDGFELGFKADRVSLDQASLRALGDTISHLLENPEQ